MKEKGRISLAKAARIAGVHYCTMYRHAHKALEGDPQAAIKDVQQNPSNKYITVSYAEVALMRRKRPAW
jgi:hypothetical protein